MTVEDCDCEYCRHYLDVVYKDGAKRKVCGYYGYCETRQKQISGENEKLMTPAELLHSLSDYELARFLFWLRFNIGYLSDIESCFLNAWDDLTDERKIEEDSGNYEIKDIAKWLRTERKYEL